MTRAALRACARVAWRQARRAPGRAVLVIAMIALPVTALTAGATLIRTSVPTLEEHVTGQMGSAELQVRPPVDVDPHALEVLLPEGSRVVAIRQWNHTLVVNGSLVFATVYEPSVRIDEPPIPGLYELREGRVPVEPGEVAVDPRTLEVFQTRVGDNLVIGGRVFSIVGVAVRPSYAFEPLAVAAPGTLGDPPAAGDKGISAEGEVSVNTYLVNLPEGADLNGAEETIRRHLLTIAERADDPSVKEQLQAQSHEAEDVIVGREAQATWFIDDKARLTGVSFAGTALALFATGLIAAAAFAVGIRRQLRTLGLVGAAGGSPVHVRAVVLLGGTTLGMAGATIGILLGLAGAYAFTPHLHRFTHALPGPVALHVPTIIGAGLLGVVAATAAAAWPARLAVRISTLDALAARMPLPRPPGRLARYGLLIAVVGALLTGVLFKPGDNEVVLTAGLVLMLSGFLVAVPWLVTVAGRAAPLLPTASRLAVRDTARNGRRTGTAIAAAALALTAPVAVTAITLSEESHQRQTQAYIGEEHMLFGDQLQDIAGQGQSLPAAFLDAIPRAIPGAIVVQPRTAVLDFATHPPPPGEKTPEYDYPAWVEGPLITAIGEGGGQSYRRSGQVFIGDADLLRVLHAVEGIPALESGEIVTIGPGSTDDGVVNLMTFSAELAQPPRVQLPATEAGDVSYSSDMMPSYVVSAEAAERYGLLPGPPSYFGAIAAAPGPITDEQLDAVKDIASKYPGVYVQTIDVFRSDFGPVRLAATAGAALIALAIVAVVIALLGAEARRDQAILVAVGGAPRARRRIAAARAGLVALLAAVIGLPAGFAPVAVVQWSRHEGFPVVVPWLTMAIVLFGVPMVAAGWGWLTSRAPKGSAMLQPIA